jgi:hypothetical protein
VFFFKLLLVAAVALAVMVAVKDGRILAEAGLRGSCVPLASPAGQSGAWYACSEGRVTGRPDMSRHDCTAQGLRGDLEVWRCPAALSGDRTTG